MNRAPQPGGQPAQPDPIRIPGPDDPELLAAIKKKQQAEMASRNGKASTEMSADKGPAYSRTTLG